MERDQCERIFAVMQSGGFLDAIAAAGPDLERVRRYLDRFANQEAPDARLKGQPTTYPSFPGLHHRRFHSAEDFPAARILEDAFAVIAAEVEGLEASRELDYVPISRLLMRLLSLFNKDLRRIRWRIYPLFYMGVKVETSPPACPATFDIVKSLPEVCTDYPWGDALVSIQRPHSRLPSHSSIDNLRVRCHLGITIPDRSGIRVGGEDRTWERGRCLLFEDSFEHEVWNDSRRRRVVLIVDLWHPGLTRLEREALTAGFRKREVRSLFMRDRIKLTDNPDRYVRLLERDLAASDSHPLIRRYWRSP